jgi:two-component system, chemotaxis family, protein-glutamate methylesterase/glutaminase
MKEIKVLIVDDSALVRNTYKVLLESDPEIKVIGTAGDPYIAVQKIQKEKPDVITLDIEMPRMDGLTFLKKIMSQAPMPVLIISNQTVHGADVALKALEAGAADVMAKPSMSTEEEIMESRITLIDKIKSVYQAKNLRQEKKTKSVTASVQKRFTRNVAWNSQSIIAIGASTGGTEAIKEILRNLQPQTPPIVIVQHMPEKFTTSFANRLNEICTIRVKEAEDSDVLMPGTAYVAPGGLHMAIKRFQGTYSLKIFHGELINRHRPSVNVLFNSVAEVAGKHAVGILLTGMGDDGATGMLGMYEKGAYTIAQDEATCAVFGMPMKAIAAGGVSKVLPLGEISQELCLRVGISSPL